MSDYSSPSSHIAVHQELSSKADAFEGEGLQRQRELETTLTNHAPLDEIATAGAPDLCSVCYYKGVCGHGPYTYK